MYTKILVIAALFISIAADGYSQDTIPKKDSLGWKLTGSAGLNFSQLHLSNWTAGGQSSLTLLTMGNLQLKKKTMKANWENTLNLAYGLLRPTEGIWLKSDDRIEFASKYGRKAFKSFHYTAATTFRTQFAPGYNYPNDSTKISEFMAPGYLLVSLGLDWKPREFLTVFVSPATGKITFVFDEDLADEGAYGVTPAVYENGVRVLPGEQIRKEWGAYMKAVFDKKIAENMNLKSQLELFSNYLDRPENIDVNWETLLLMKVNKYITVNLGVHMVYDHDIDIPIDTNNDGTPDHTGPRLQLKELLSVGLLYQW